MAQRAAGNAWAANVGVRAAGLAGAALLSSQPDTQARPLGQLDQGHGCAAQRSVGASKALAADALSSGARNSNETT